MKQPVMQDMSAVMYLRYSSDNQTEQSIEGQRHVCMNKSVLYRHKNYEFLY